MTMRFLVRRRRLTPSLIITISALSLLAAGCASLANTPAQDLAWSRWTACSPQATGVDVRTIRLDGRITFWYEGSADRQALLDCVRMAAKDGPALPEPIGEPRECGGSGSM